MKKNLFVIFIILLSVGTSFSQKRDSVRVSIIYDRVFTKFSRGEYLKVLNEIDIILKGKLNESEKQKLNELYENSKKCVLINEQIKYFKGIKSEINASNYLDSLNKINPNDPRIVISYLKTGDTFLKLGELSKAAESYKKYLNTRNTKGLRSRMAYSRLLQSRAKYQFEKDNIEFYWIDEYATMVKKSIVGRLKKRSIDSLYEINKDSLKYKKWKTPVYIVGGVNYDNYLLGKNQTNKYTLLTYPTSTFGVRVFLTQPMQKLSYFLDLVHTTHIFQNVEVIDGVNYEVEKIKYSSIAIPVNIKFNLTNGAKHLYTNAGITPIFKVSETYINEFRNQNVKKLDIINSFQVGLNGGIGFQIESKKDRKALFFQLNANYKPLNLINRESTKNPDFNTTVVTGNFLFGVKF